MCVTGANTKKQKQKHNKKNTYNPSNATSAPKDLIVEDDINSRVRSIMGRVPRHVVVSREPPVRAVPGRAERDIGQSISRFGELVFGAVAAREHVFVVAVGAVGGGGGFRVGGLRVDGGGMAGSVGGEDGRDGGDGAVGVDD